MRVGYFTSIGRVLLKLFWYCSVRMISICIQFIFFKYKNRCQSLHFLFIEVAPMYQFSLRWVSDKSVSRNHIYALICCPYKESILLWLYSHQIQIKRYALCNKKILSNLVYKWRSNCVSLELRAFFSVFG